MDQILAKAGNTLVTFAVRSGVQIASTYVIKSVGTMMDNVPVSERRRVSRLKTRLETRIEIVTHATELIRLVASRGNTSLDSTLRLADELKLEIEDFQEEIEVLMEGISEGRKMSTEEIKAVELLIKSLLGKIDQSIPILNLALATCGGQLSGDVNAIISPGQLLRATTMVEDSNRAYVKGPEHIPVPVGPQFDLIMYDVFYNAAAKPGAEVSWREKYARCIVQVMRVYDENFDYSYNLEITESFDDERFHDDDETPGKYVVDLRLISRLFFGASGRLLKLEESSPVLVTKLRRETRKQLDEQMLARNPGEVGADSGFKWVAFSEYDRGGESDDDDDDDGDDDDDESEESSEEDNDSRPKEDEFQEAETGSVHSANAVSSIRNARTAATTPTLSLLEYIVRLCALQANDQTSILEVKDERLRLYLNDESALMQSSTAVPVPELSSKLKNLNVKDRH